MAALGDYGMLIITRKRDQGFFLGDNVKITIREISGDSVRVAIDAPKEIKILREELVEEILEEYIKTNGWD